ncbi:MAG: citrate lyase holo-[acyl-carrier protein] synthase [Thermovenabulum sp.]|uniref:citrate lyase holo-[acyl-carrier protein] synthase n=1 Tax=Thermovenabulum sp. TaxID=3100335 RepID=UPI003C7E0219
MIRILEDREKRFLKILKLYEEYNLPVLCGKINYPGNNKNTLEANLAFNVLYSLLIKEFKKFIIHRETDEGYDGKSLLLVLNMDKFEAKKLAVEIEESHPLGRIFDIDIYEGEVPVSRRELGFDERKCVFCGKNVRECSREKRHKVEEVVRAINLKIQNFVSKE